MRHALLVAALALAGCNSILGVGEFRTGDGGVGDDVIDAMVEPDADPASVTGTSMIGYVDFDGTIVTAPEDLSVYTIKAYIPNGDDTFTILDGVGNADGTFEIRDVPIGATYYLYLLYADVPNHPPQTPLFWVTDERHLDLGYQVMGRADAVEANLATSVVLNLTDMAPWAANDVLLVDSYNNGSEFYGLGSQVTNAPLPGETATLGLTFDWRNGYTYHPVGSLPRLVDPARGDDFFVTHLHEELVSNGGLTTYAVTRQAGVFRADDVTQADGQTVMVNGAFTPITFDQTQAITVNVAAYRDLFNPDLRGTDDSFAISQLDNAGTQHGARIGSGPWSVAWGFTYGTMRGNGDFIDLPDLAYGESTLFPPTWGHMVISNYGLYRRFAARGANSAQMIDFIDATQQWAPTLNMAPVLRPVASISIGGMPALLDAGAVAFDGTHGVKVEWDVVLQAQRYQVTLFRVFADVAATRRQRILRFTTAENSVVLPPDLLVQGEQYNLAVSTNTGVDTVGLRRFRIPGASSLRHTNVFLFTPACGDGVPDTSLGEECDTMGASATCDADCTLPRCRDTTLNTAAGEECDHGNPTFGCDSDCTFVVCGDDLWNQIVEDCDDGNLVDDGNGCSATCTRIGTCGDGVLQALVEQCEPAGTATCTVGCRIQ